MPLQRYIKSLRKFRVWHRLLGLSLSLLVVVSAITGIFLALKKDIPAIQPSTQKGISKDLHQWLPMYKLDSLAQLALIAKDSSQKDNLVNRIDVRPSKGIAKVIFKKGYWEVQLDGVSGEVKSVERRHSDWIEALHDGSIIGDLFKLISMNFLGIGLTLLVGSGLWLWYGPKKIRRLKKQIPQEEEA